MTDSPKVDVKNPSDPDALVRTKLKAYFAAPAAESKKSFCARTHVPYQSLMNWLRGTMIPVDALKALGFGLGLQPWELIRPQGAQPTPEEPSVLEAVAIIRKLDEPQRREALAWLRGFARGAQAEKEALSKRGDAS